MIKERETQKKHIVENTNDSERSPGAFWETDEEQARRTDGPQKSQDG